MSIECTTSANSAVTWVIEREVYWKQVLQSLMFGNNRNYAVLGVAAGAARRRAARCSSNCR
jgi:hypothetical protein